MEDLVLSIMSDEDKKSYNFSLSDHYYVYKRDGISIGYARLNIELPHQVYIFIDNKIRGNGYGTKLFKEILTILKNNNIKEIEIETPVRNIAMIRILEHYNGKEMTRYGGIAHYIVPIN